MAAARTTARQRAKRNAIVNKAREAVAGNHDLIAKHQKAWETTLKKFRDAGADEELITVARLAMLQGVIDGKTPRQAAAEAKKLLP